MDRERNKTRRNEITLFNASVCRVPIDFDIPAVVVFSFRLLPPMIAVVPNSHSHHPMTDSEKWFAVLESMIEIRHPGYRALLDWPGTELMSFAL